MMLGAVEAASHMGLTKVFLTGTDEDWKPTLEAVSESRRRIKESPVQNPKVTNSILLLLLLLVRAMISQDFTWILKGLFILHIS